MAKLIHCSGKRKTAIARATLKPGNGVVKINNRLISTIKPEALRMRLEEPLILAGDITGVNISVRVFGGGSTSQAEAARLAVARALAKHTRRLEKVFLNYDRHLLVADVRRKETHKPNCRGKARSKKQKSYR